VIDYLEQMEAASAGFPQAEWTTTRPTARVAAIKQRLLDEPRYLDVERARYTTEAYRATEGQPMARRRAQMLLHLVRQQSITIQPGELIVGNRSLLPRMGIIAPEGAVAWIDKELDILPTRPQDRFNTTPEVIRALRAEIFPYWRGYTLEDTVAQRVPDDVRVAVKGRAFSLNQLTTHRDTFCLTWRRGCGWVSAGCVSKCWRRVIVGKKILTQRHSGAEMCREKIKRNLNKKPLRFFRVSASLR
jgi:hypothetical protein